MADKGYTKSEIWKNIFGIIVPYKKRFFLVVFISLLSTGANLIEPLIYREAINDVAGLFVQKAKDDTRKAMGSDSVSTANDSTIIEDKNVFEDGEKEAHQKDHVASRTPEQAIRTLLWAVALIFLVNIAGHILVLIGANMNVKLACNIEQGFIQNTFAHVLKQPLTFFSKRSSAGLSKQINQSEEVSAVVNGFSEQILPEIISLTGILIIMFSQNVYAVTHCTHRNSILPDDRLAFSHKIGNRSCRLL